MNRLILETTQMTGNPCAKKPRDIPYEEALEMAADALLNAQPKDPAYPAYTERQLARHGEGFMMGSVEAMETMLAAVRPTQTALDELKFLITVTSLSRREKICLRAWILGWTQKELSDHWAKFTRMVSQQSISRWLRTALLKCYDASGIGFHIFSHHAVYRAPMKRREVPRVRICPYCHEIYPFGLGTGRYCSPGCFDAAQYRRG